MIKIRVDFNRRGRDGLVVASKKRADGELSVGDRVEAVQAEDDLSFEGIVTDIDDKGRVFLQMLWETDKSAPAPTRRLYEIHSANAVGFSHPSSPATTRRFAVSGNFATSQTRATAG